MAPRANHVLDRFVGLILSALAGRRKFRQNRQRRLIPACLSAQNVHTETLAGRVITSRRPKDWTYVFSNFPADRADPKAGVA